MSNKKSLKHCISVLLSVLLILNFIPWNYISGISDVVNAAGTSPEITAEESTDIFETGEPVPSESGNSDDTSLPEDSSLPTDGDEESFGAATYSKSGFLSYNKLTKKQITDLYKLANSDNVTTRFVTAPSTVNPYSIGKLDDEFIESGLNYLNYCRKVAGLNAVTPTDEYNEAAQYGAVVLAANNVLSHYPEKPADMDEDFYQKGYNATSSSNISSRGYTYWTTDELNNLIVSSVKGCMEDNSSNLNLTCMGHRRWFLNPPLGKVGFGCADSATKKNGYEYKYIVNKVFDSSFSYPDYDFISWPSSGYFPNELVTPRVPWTVTIDPAKVNNSTLQNAVITVTRESDSKTWTLDINDRRTSVSKASDMATEYFNYDTNYYAVNNVLIFCVGSDSVDSSKFEGVYNVKITGLKDRSGNAFTIDYDIDFFNTAEADPDAVSKVELIYKGTGTSIGGLTVEAGYNYNNLFEAKISPETALNKNVTWSSSDTAVMTVDQSGNFKTLKNGVASLIVTTEDGNKTASCPIYSWGTYPTPDAPTLKSATTTTIELNAVSGCKYSKDGTNYQDSAKFTNLNPNTEYTFYIKKVKNESEYMKESAASSAKFKTLAETVHVSSVSLTPDSKTFKGTDSIGQTFKFTATVLPSEANDKTVTWKSSNTSVATVSNGTITTKGYGKTTITVTTNDGGKTDTATVEVWGVYPTPAAPSAKAVTTASIELNAITGCVYSKDGTNYQSSTVFTNLNPDTEYTFYIKKSKNASEYMEESAASSAKLSTLPESGPEIIHVREVTVSPSAYTLKGSDTLGKTVKFTATVSPANADDRTVTWKSSNTSVATVSNGTVTTKGYGKTTITVTANDGGKSAKATLTVWGVYPKPSAPTLKKATTNSLEINAVKGCSYSIDGKKYQSSTKFTGLSPNTAYTVYIKKNGDASAFMEESVPNKATFRTQKKTDPIDPVKPDKVKTISMYRLYNPNSGEHFYTSSQAEIKALVQAGWKNEGEAWKAPEKSKTPVYRLYNPNSGDHHYTTSAPEKNSLVSAGWKYEGIGWYSDDNKGVPLYRLYNPNATTGSHHYTTNITEKNNLVKAGWKYEGIAWFGVI